MTKRKRDICTVIESINHWFEVGEQHTNPPSDYEGSTSGLEQTTDLRLQPEIGTSAAERDTQVAYTDRGEEGGCEPPNCHIGHVEAKEITGRSKEIPDSPSNGYRPLTGTEVAAGYERGACPEGEPGHPSPDNRRVPPAGTEEEDRPEPNLTSIWKVFHDAGYDVW